MPSSLQHLIDANRVWATQMEREQPGFFQRPGASSSRPSTCGSAAPTAACRPTRSPAWRRARCSCTATWPTWWCSSDLNALSVIQFAVDVLKVEHIMVVGHYGCGGVLAVLRGTRVGLADNWLRHVHDVKMRHRGRLDAPVPARAGRRAVRDERDRAGRPCGRPAPCCRTPGRAASTCPCTGWCYGLKDGLVKDLGVTMAPAEVVDVTARPSSAIRGRPPTPAPDHVRP
jgi:carbonic anhydrase